MMSLDNCILCGVAESFFDKSEKFVEAISLAFISDFQIIFASATILWLTLQGIEIASGRKEAMQVFLKESPNIFIAWALLYLNPNGTILLIFNLVNEIMTGISIKVFEVGGVPVAGAGLAGLINSVEEGVNKILDISLDILSTTGILDPIIPLIMSGLLILPYALILIAYLSQIIVSLFRLIVLALFAPFLFLAYGFGFTQDMTKTGIKTTIATIMVMTSSTLCVSMLFFIVDSLKIHDGNFKVQWSDPDLQLAILAGWAFTALLAEGTSLANSLAQSSLTNAAAGLMSAGMGMAGLGAMKVGANPISTAKDIAGKALGTDAGKFAGATAGTLGKGAMYLAKQTPLGNLLNKKQ